MLWWRERGKGGRNGGREEEKERGKGGRNGGRERKGNLSRQVPTLNEF